MARLGLGPNWKPVFANDLSPKKAAAYKQNFSSANLLVKSVDEVRVSDLPVKPVSMAWASFPCQDLSLAGSGCGFEGHRSSAFWGFWELMQVLRSENKAPRVITIENVTGAITANAGRDFQALLEAFAKENYYFAPIVLDAIHFVPQSRPRLFVVAADMNTGVPEHIRDSGPSDLWHSKSLISAYLGLPSAIRNKWIWAIMPSPPPQATRLADILEPDAAVRWDTSGQTSHLLNLMDSGNARKIKTALAMGKRIVGTLYRRTRLGNQRAEVRFDNVSGCLRTPGGGSSRQTVVVVEDGRVRTRLISPRETARLMGVPDHYQLPDSYNDAYHLMGDGLVVPAVRWLAKHLIEPICVHQEIELATSRLVLAQPRRCTSTHLRPTRLVPGY